MPTALRNLSGCTALHPALAHPPTLCQAPPPVALASPPPRSDLAAEFNGEVAIGVPQAKAASGQPDGPIGVANNNYVRDQGQNVG